MSFLHKKIERRTFSEDRYYILIKRQKSGEATMRDLDELDEIVNRVPDIREKVLRENFEEFAAGDDMEQGGDANGSISKIPVQNRRHILDRISSFFRGLFTINARPAREKFSAFC